MQPIEHDSSFIDGAYRSAFFPAADGTSELLASAWFHCSNVQEGGIKGLNGTVMSATHAACSAWPGCDGSARHP